jgi:CBS domain-containing membrane protein
MVDTFHRTWRLFVPILAGGSLRDRLFACLGAAIGIALTGVVGWLTLGASAGPWLVAPVGASAVLLFAVPASPLAQPWSIVGGNVVSALVGVAIAQIVPLPVIAAGLAVGLAILAMSLLRCLHPPGGAAALTAVIGGKAVAGLGFAFPFLPVGLNSVLLVLVGLAFHRFSGHSYPHRPVPVAGHAPPEHLPVLDILPEDIDLALADLGETFDISRSDLETLFQRVEAHAAHRRFVS